MSKKSLNIKITKENYKYYLALFAIVFVLHLVSEYIPERTKPSDLDISVDSSEQLNSEKGIMKVHFLDVDQGLCIMVQLGENVLIYDGGERDVSSKVVAYLKEQGVKEIDYMISSHYDSDHVSGLIGCLRAFNVKNVIGSDYEHESNLYDSFMEAVKNEGLRMQYPKVGTEYAFGDAVITILSPKEIQKDSNANSVAIKLSYDEMDFIFTGDADYTSEKAMVASGIDLDCEVLSAGHHGSSSSSSSLFLEKTNPYYVVISCGEDNSYGHPHVEVVEMLEAMEVELFRNDVQGTVVACTDGEKIVWSEEPCNDFTDGD
jgi:beta-lactamase superfamily II metal-dependent hydrolase